MIEFDRVLPVRELAKGDVFIAAGSVPMLALSEPIEVKHTDGPALELQVIPHTKGKKSYRITSTNPSDTMKFYSPDKDEVRVIFRGVKVDLQKRPTYVVEVR